MATEIKVPSLGESVTLLAGENGSGKSTILEAIAAAIVAGKGSLELDAEA